MYITGLNFNSTRYKSSGLKRPLTNCASRKVGKRQRVELHDVHVNRSQQADQSGASGSGPGGTRREPATSGPRARPRGNNKTFATALRYTRTGQLPMTGGPRVRDSTWQGLERSRWSGQLTRGPRLAWQERGVQAQSRAANPHARGEWGSLRSVGPIGRHGGPHRRAPFLCGSHLTPVAWVRSRGSVGTLSVHISTTGLQQCK